MRNNYFYIIFSIIIFQPIFLQAQISSRWNRESSFYFYRFIDEKLDAEKATFNKSLTREQILYFLAFFFLLITSFLKTSIIKIKRRLVLISIASLHLIQLTSNIELLL